MSSNFQGNPTSTAGSASYSQDPSLDPKQEGDSTPSTLNIDKVQETLQRMSRDFKLTMFCDTEDKDKDWTFFDKRYVEDRSKRNTLEALIRDDQNNIDLTILIEQRKLDESWASHLLWGSVKKSQEEGETEKNIKEFFGRESTRYKDHVKNLSKTSMRIMRRRIETCSCPTMAGSVTHTDKSQHESKENPVSKVCVSQDLRKGQMTDT